MKKIYIVCILFFLSGCATTGLINPSGYAAVSVVKTSGGLGLDRGDVKHGESCSHNVLGLVAFGDSSIAAAKKNGGVDKVSYFDKDIISVLSFYGKICTTVYGVKKKEGL